jgi:hypothetical protein
LTTIGICGDNCLYCPRYLATLSGKAEELERVKELWVRLDLREPSFPAQDLACYGCLPDNDCAYSELRACVLGKDIESCGLCEAYPCQIVSAVFEKSERLIPKALSVCTPDERELLRKAFFSKRENLEKKKLEEQEKGKG